MGERSCRLVRIPAKILGGAATALGDHTTDAVMTEEEGQRRERSSNRHYLIKSDPGFAQKKLMRSRMTGSGGKLNFCVGIHHTDWREQKIGSTRTSFGGNITYFGGKVNLGVRYLLFTIFLLIPVPAFPVVGPKKINLSGPNKITNISC
jgi:hypothetical protein